MPAVNPAIMRWARETAGLTSAEATKKLGLRAAQGASASERLAALEEGDATPSRPMLLKMSKVYRRPLLTFYLSEPPRIADRGKDFRKLPQGQPKEEEALLDALVRGIRARQSLVRAALEDEEDTTRNPFIGSINLSDGPSKALATITADLGISTKEYREAATLDEAFKTLRSKIESAGIFVLLAGNLGSYHSAISPKTFRGVALADPIAPFIVINDEDSKIAWPFTLLHELTHLWLGETGISGTSFESRVEIFCNEVGAQFLLPREELDQLNVHQPLSLGEAEAQISGFAESRKVSRSMVAYSLLRRGTISHKDWTILDSHFYDLFQAEKRKERPRRKKGGPNFYTVRRHRLGPGLINLTSHLMSIGSLTTSKAGYVLGIKPKQVQVLLEDLESLGRAS